MDLQNVLNYTDEELQEPDSNSLRDDLDDILQSYYQETDQETFLLPNPNHPPRLFIDTDVEVDDVQDYDFNLLSGELYYSIL